MTQQPLKHAVTFFLLIILQCVSAPAHEIVDALSEQEGYTPQIFAEPSGAYAE